MNIALWYNQWKVEDTLALWLRNSSPRYILNRNVGKFVLRITYKDYLSTCILSNDVPICASFTVLNTVGEKLRCVVHFWKIYCSKYLQGFTFSWSQTVNNPSVHLQQNALMNCVTSHSGILHSNENEWITSAYSPWINLTNYVKSSQTQKSKWCMIPFT